MALTKQENDQTPKCKGILDLWRNKQEDQIHDFYLEKERQLRNQDPIVKKTVESFNELFKMVEAEYPSFDAQDATIPKSYKSSTGNHYELITRDTKKKIEDLKIAQNNKVEYLNEKYNEILTMLTAATGWYEDEIAVLKAYNVINSRGTLQIGGFIDGCE